MLAIGSDCRLVSAAVPNASAGDAAGAHRIAILAGGAGSRMGSPKAGVELAGRALIEHGLAAARLARLSPVVVARDDSGLPELRASVLIEPAGPRHPLNGIVAALEHAREPIVVLACDLPLVPADLLAELARRRAPFAMPLSPRPQPLVARYSPGLLPRLREALASEEPMTRVALELGGDGLREAELRGFGDPERMFLNVNDREQLAAAERLLRGARGIGL
jgi:molybdopterin-guanine dinucleotide biosynthesis protein A